MKSDRSMATLRSPADCVIIFVLWLLIVAAMLYGYSDNIAKLSLADPDDAMRLVQVRDFMAGQNWYDLTQYRVNPAEGGGQLHWSRFIDVQIAGLVLLLQQFLPAVEAERWALTFYPMLLILPVLLIFHRLLARLGDQMFVRVGLIVAATSFSFLHYFVPLRIDHHNWQLLMSLAMLWLALGPATFARGLAAALAISVHVEISLEGLPYLVIFGALFAYDWLRRPESAARLRGFAAGLVIIPLLWILGLRGFDAIFGVYCDAFSRPYLVGVATTGVILACWMGNARLSQHMRGRLVALAVAGIAGGVAFVAAGPECLAGPFGNLSPLVREHWYEVINEGLAIWQQSPLTMVSFTLPSLAGLIGLVWTTRVMAGRPEGDTWHRLTLVAVGSIILSVLVLRTTAVTHAYVVPGYVLAIITIFRWGRSHTTAIARVPATAAAMLALPLSLSAAAVGVMTHFAPADEAKMPTDCLTPAVKDGLRQLPAGIVFTSLDISPGILSATMHKVVATGHHRNHQVMHRVLTAFMGTSAVAEKIVRESGASYVVVCRNLPEYRNFIRFAPDGFTAALDKDRPPQWLRSDPAHSFGPMRIYRVLGPKPE